MESNFIFKSEEERQSYERFAERVRVLQEQIEADPSVGVRLLQKAGIWDENGQPTEKYRDDEG